MNASTISPGLVLVLGAVVVLLAGFLWWAMHRRPANLLLDRTANSVLENVLEGLGDSCLLIDSNGIIIFANHETRDLFRTSERPKGMALSILVQDERIVSFIKRAATSGQKWQEEEFRVPQLQNGGAEERYLVVSAAPVRLFGEDSACHTRVVIRDETDRHETEQIRKDFVANASHELRTPLSIINGYLENLLDGVIDEPVMMRKSLVTMRKHGERIARIVEDMLTLSKFESATEGGNSALRQTFFSCQECVEDVIERLSPMIEQKLARIELDFPRVGDDLIDGDRFYWDQIFFNLIENALKENPVGVLTVRVGMKREKGGAIIQISDNGVGIPRADLPFIFKRFYRVAKHHNQKIKGTGLGLSIVRRAVEAHGGTITVDSILGVETTFKISLPDMTAAPAGRVLSSN